VCSQNGIEEQASGRPRAPPTSCAHKLTWAAGWRAVAAGKVAEWWWPLGWLALAFSRFQSL